MSEKIKMHRVEVSGWDQNEEFFVERTALQWDEGEYRTVLVRRRVRQGALVFVRPLDTTEPARAFPVAYRVRQMEERENGALRELKLNQVWPAVSSPPAASPEMLEAAHEQAARFH
jgi:hypothetical protein